MQSQRTASARQPFLLHPARHQALPVVHTEDGPTGGDALSATTFIQRLNTQGGLAPADGCSGLADVGAKAFRRYTADFFYRNDDRH